MIDAPKKYIFSLFKVSKLENWKLLAIFWHSITLYALLSILSNIKKHIFFKCCSTNFNSIIFLMERIGWCFLLWKSIMPCHILYHHAMIMCVENGISVEKEECKNSHKNNSNLKKTWQFFFRLCQIAYLQTWD